MLYRGIGPQLPRLETIQRAARAPCRSQQHPHHAAHSSPSWQGPEAATAGTWSRLKCCPGRRCGWAFYDRSASSRSRWCSMQVCGARAKMRAYRDRQARW